MQAIWTLRIFVQKFSILYTKYWSCSTFIFRIIIFFAWLHSWLNNVDLSNIKYSLVNKALLKHIIKCSMSNHTRNKEKNLMFRRFHQSNLIATINREKWHGNRQQNSFCLSNVLSSQILFYSYGLFLDLPQNRLLFCSFSSEIRRFFGCVFPLKKNIFSTIIYSSSKSEYDHLSI